MQLALQLSPAEMLASLHRLRWCAVAAALFIIAGTRFILDIRFSAGPLLALTALLALWNLLVTLRLRRAWATTDLEVAVHLAIDTLALSALLYWGGGSTSPFVSLYLIPIAIAAATLPAIYAWGIAALAASVYSLLLFTTLPGAHVQHDGFAMHVFGMWVTFVFGGLLLLIFVAGMAAAVRKRDHDLAHAREQMLRNEQITALGALAAGAAHELSTPLSTMTLTLEELRLRYAQNPEFVEDVETLESQIALCKSQVGKLLGAAEHARGEPGESLPLDAWLTQTLDRWRLMRPEVQCCFSLQQPFRNPDVAFDESVSQSLISLLNNAADASLENNASEVRIIASSDQGRLDITIEDDGRGLREQDRARAGRLRFSTKTQGQGHGGHGLGLLLSHVSLERLGGEVSLSPHTQGGTRTSISLPLPA